MLHLAASVRAMMPALCLVGTICASAEAISIRHDVPVASYNALASQSEFAAAGFLADSLGQFCTGTLISPTQVLTASHCVDDDANGVVDPSANLNSIAFGFAANLPFNPTPNISAAAINPEWVNSGGDAAFDVAVLTLSSPINNVVPAKFSDQDPTGLIGTLVGYGEQGSGNSFPSNLSGSNDRLAANNRIDASLGVVQTDFDNLAGNTSTLGSATPLALEGTTGPGDSGGPLFANFDGVELVVGTLNGGANEIPGNQDSEYGDVSDWAALRSTQNLSFLAGLGITPFVASAGVAGDYNNNGIVDAADYATWLDNLGAAAGTLPNDTSGGAIGQAQYGTWKANFGNSAEAGLGNSAGHSVPEPGSWVLLLGALLAIVCANAGGPLRVS